MPDPLICDACVTLSLLMGDEESMFQRQIAEAASASVLHVPAIWPAEVINSLRSNVLRGRLEAEDLEPALSQVLRLRCRVAAAPEPGQWSRWLHEVAVDGGCSGYDASYLLLAAHLDAVLATRDGNLRRVARLMNIPCLRLEDASA